MGPRGRLSEVTHCCQGEMRQMHQPQDEKHPFIISYIYCGSVLTKQNYGFNRLLVCSDGENATHDTNVFLPSFQVIHQSPGGWLVGVGSRAAGHFLVSWSDHIAGPAELSTGCRAAVTAPRKVCDRWPHWNTHPRLASVALRLLLHWDHSGPLRCLSCPGFLRGASLILRRSRHGRKAVHT